MNASSGIFQKQFRGGKLSTGYGSLKAFVGKALSEMFPLLSKAFDIVVD